MAERILILILILLLIPLIAFGAEQDTKWPSMYGTIDTITP